MKRKIITYFLLSVFVLSTIGIPVSLHYCEMMNIVSLNACGMCDKKTSTCCDEENQISNIKSLNDVSCCSNKLIAASSDEKYLSVSPEVQNTEVKSFIFIIPLKQYLIKELSYKTFISDNSPPASYSNSIYLDNSLLLI